MQKNTATGGHAPDDGFFLVAYRFAVIAAVIFIFIPNLNPARVSGLVDRTQSLLTSGLSFNSLTDQFVRPVQRGWIEAWPLHLLYYTALGSWIGIVLSAAGAAASLGELRLRRRGLLTSFAASLFSLVMGSLMFISFSAMGASANPERIQPMFPLGLPVFLGLNLAIVVLALLALSRLRTPGTEDRLEMQPRFRLFLMLLPFLVLTFMFAYLPLWGWVVSFFDYRAGFALTPERFVGLKWFSYLFENPATRADVLRVLRNTLAMSGLGIGTSWFAMAFAIFLSEIKHEGYRRTIQTLTTIPNFISWVLIYTFALAMFSTEGFVNSLLLDIGAIESPILFLQNPDHIWLRMLAWGIWKGLGWSAIIYLAAITSIDPQLFEAATVDGAGRFRKIWHITVPALLPTYFVLLLLMIAGVLSNGMEQYFVFKNAINKESIEVLDLYVYVLGLGSGGASNIALATVVSMMKSLVSVVLLFVANRASKLIRGESIV